MGRWSKVKVEESVDGEVEVEQQVCKVKVVTTVR